MPVPDLIGFVVTDDVRMEGLEPAQREKTFAALAEGYTLLGAIFVDMTPRGSEWKVVDVTVPSFDSLSLAGLMDAEASKWKAARTPGVTPPAAPSPPVAAKPEPEEPRSLDRSRVAVMVGGGLVAAVIAFFVLRWLLARSRI
jgi:hypothetical protein